MAKMFVTLVIVLLGITVTSSSYLSQEEIQCLQLDSRPPTDFIWPNKTVNFVLDRSLNDKPRISKWIREAIHEWESNTCIKFKDYTIRKIPQNINIIKFVYQPNNRCQFSLQNPQTCGCVREIGLAKPCSSRWTVEKHIGWHLGISYQPDQSTTKLKLINEINTLYHCNNTCLFTPVCHDGGYVVPDASSGCGKCVCQNNEDCQEVNHVDPNLHVLTDTTKKGMTDGTQKAFEQLEKKFKITDKRITHVSAGALTAVGKIIDGDIEGIPKQLAMDQLEMALGTGLEKVLEGVKLAGPIAAGIAAAAVGILNGIIQGSVKEAVKGCISAGIGTFVGQAIGALIGTALAGPFGTIIGEILGGIIGGFISSLVSWIVDKIIDAIWPLLEQLAAVIYQFLKDVIVFLQQAWEKVKEFFWGFAVFIAGLFG